MSANSEQSVQTVVLLDSVFDIMTALIVDLEHFEVLISTGSDAPGQQCQHHVNSELSALTLTLAEAHQRLRRCQDACRPFGK